MLKTKYCKRNKYNTENLFKKLAYVLGKDVANSTKEAKEKGKLLLSYEKGKGYRIVEIIDNKGTVQYPLGETFFPPRAFVDVLNFSLQVVIHSKQK